MRSQHSVWEAEQAEATLESNLELLELQAEHAQAMYELRSEAAQAEEAAEQFAQEVVTERQQRIAAEEGVVSAMRIVQMLEEKLAKLSGAAPCVLSRDAPPISVPPCVTFESACECDSTPAAHWRARCGGHTHAPNLAL